MALEKDGDVVPHIEEVVEEVKATEDETSQPQTAAALGGLLQMFERAQSDEERFAILLLISKTTPPGDLECIKTVYDVTGLTFISRLLLTEPSDSSSKEHDTKKDIEEARLSMYQSFGLTLLSTFSCLPEAAGSSEYLSHADLLIDIVQRHPLASESFIEALTSIAGSLDTPEGRNVYRRYKLTSVLTKILRSNLELAEDTKEVLSLLIATTTKSLQPDGTVSCAASTIKKYICVLAECFASREDMSKFDSCINLATCLDYLSSRDVYMKSDLKFQLNIREGLTAILSSRLSDVFRGYALRLGAAMMLHYEGKFADWALAASTAENETRTLLIQLLTQLACVDIRLIIEYKPIQEVLAYETTEVLSSCFVILESALAYITKSNDDIFDMHQRLNTAIAGAFMAIISFIQGIRNNFSSASEIDSERDRLDLSDPGTMNNATECLRAAVRLLGVWLAEDLPTDRSGLVDVIPFILKQSQDSAVDSQQMVQFMLPAYCHLSAEHDTVEVLLENDLPAILLNFLRGSLSPKEQERASWVTDVQGTCSVFLNIVVENPSDIIHTSPIFCDLGNTIMNFFSSGSHSSTTQSQPMQTLYDHLITVATFLRYQKVVNFDGKQQSAFEDAICDLLIQGIKTMPTIQEAESADEDTANQHSLWQLCTSVVISPKFDVPDLYEKLNNDKFAEACANVIVGANQWCVRERGTVIALAKRVAGDTTPCDSLRQILGSKP